MRVATHEERDALLGINDVLLETLRGMARGGHDLGEMIALLRRSSVPMPAASIALIRAGVAEGLRGARLAVDESRAYARWPEPDEAYAPCLPGANAMPERSKAAA